MRLFFYSIILSFTFNSCVKNNPDPSWLEVNEWTLQKNPSANYDAGVLTHNFTDAWVFVDNKIIGVFEVPFKIPILKSGNVNIKIYPTVKNNGISATKKIYPFMDVFEIDTILEQNEILVLNPFTQYNQRTKFWIEDFEDAAMKLDNDQNTPAAIISESNPLHLKYGNFYGHVNLNSTDSIWVAYTNGQLVLPKSGREVCLEVDYKNTNSIITGILAVSPSSTHSNTNVQMNKQSSDNAVWKKIYIDLKEPVSYYSDATYYTITFQALLDAGLTESDIYIDNIKVLYTE